MAPGPTCWRRSGHFIQGDEPKDKSNRGRVPDTLVYYGLLMASRPLIISNVIAVLINFLSVDATLTTSTKKNRHTLRERLNQRKRHRQSRYSCRDHVAWPREHKIPTASFCYLACQRHYTSGAATAKTSRSNHGVSGLRGEENRHVGLAVKASRGEQAWFWPQSGRQERTNSPLSQMTVPNSTLACWNAGLLRLRVSRRLRDGFGHNRSPALTKFTFGSMQEGTAQKL